MQITKLEQKTGTEGPRYDPWSYTESIVHLASGDVATLHVGLAVWFKFNDVRSVCYTEQDCDALFEQATGLTGIQFEEAYQRVTYYCRRCNTSKFIYGESYELGYFYICRKCNQIVHEISRDMS